LNKTLPGKICLVFLLTILVFISSVSARIYESPYSTEVSGVPSADKEPPVTTISIGTPQYRDGENLYISSSTSITLSAVDYGIVPSGVNHTEYRIDGGQWQTYSSAFTLTTEGTHTIYYRSIDNVGNTEADKSIIIILDKTPPQTTISTSDPLSIVSPRTKFTLSSTDNLSGVQEISYSIDGGSWKTYMANFSLSGMSAGKHTIAYKAKDNVSNEEAESSITVTLIVIEVSKSISPIESSVLAGVWSDNSDSEQKQTDTNNLDSILSSLNINYYIATTKDDFTTALRSGIYNTYLLVDFKEQLIGDEIREAVYYGDGLIFIKTNPQADPFLDDVFGVKFTGKTTNSDLIVYLTESPISSEGTLKCNGKNVVATINSDTAESFGYVVDKHNTYDSIIFNQYKRGKVILYNFDLLSVTDQSQVKSLISNSLSHVMPVERYIRALDSVPLDISLKNSTEPVDVKVIETIPDKTTADTIYPQASQTDNTITWQKYLNANEQAEFGYYLNLPDASGDYVTNTELRYSNNGDYRLYGNYSYTLSVTNNSTELLNSIITDLNNVSTTNSDDADKIAGTIEILNQINTNATTKKDAENNIKSIVNAIDKIRKVSSDVSDIRLKLDELLKIWEKKWYLMEE
jgi:hypothetical protein